MCLSLPGSGRAACVGSAVAASCCCLLMPPTPLASGPFSKPKIASMLNGVGLLAAICGGCWWCRAAAAAAAAANWLLISSKWVRLVYPSRLGVCIMTNGLRPRPSERERCLSPRPLPASGCGLCSKAWPRSKRPRMRLG